MQAKSCDASTRMRFEIDRVIEALVFAALFFLPWHNEALIRNSFNAENPFGRMLFMAAGLLWIIRKIAYRERLFLPAPFWALAAMAGWGWNRLLIAGNPAPDLIPLRITAESAALFLFASDFYRDPARRERLLRFFLLWMGLVCLSGIWQMLSPRGLDFLAGRSGDAPGRLTRMSGPFGSPNGLAAFLLLALPLSFEKWASFKFSKQTAPWMLLTALLSVCFVATLSRAAFLALWIAVLALCLFRRRAALALLAIPPAAVALEPYLRQNFFASFAGFDITASFRLNAWKEAWQTLLANPWGVGLSALHGRLAPLTPDTLHYAGSHNSYLQIAAEMGWPAILLFAAAVLAVLARKCFAAPAGFRLALAALAIHAFFDADFGRFKIAALFWLFAGVLEGARAQTNDPAPLSGTPAGPAWTSGVLWAAGAVIFAAVFALPFTQSDLRSFWIAQMPYAILWLLVLTACHAALGFWNGIRALRSIPVWLLCAAAAAAVFWAVRPDLRVVSDEAQLLMVSRAMADYSRVDFAYEGIVQNGVLLPQTLMFPIRPLLFPFLVHLLHRPFGYMPENAFAVNFFVLTSCLFVAYAGVRRVTGSLGWGLAASIALLSQPILLLSASSGGFEALQLLLFLVSLLATVFFLEKPQEERRFRLLWLCLALLSQVRYESLIYGISAIAVLSFFRKIPASHYVKSWVYAATPFLLLPWLWQRMLFWNYFPASVPQGAALYSLGSFMAHFGDFACVLFDYSRDLPYNPAVYLLGLLGIAQMLRRGYSALREGVPSDRGVVSLAFGLPALAVSAGFCAYAESGLRLPQSSRYLVLGGALLSLCAAFFLYSVLRARRAWLAAALLVCTLLYFLPAASRPRLGPESDTNFEYRFVRVYLKRAGPEERRLWVSRRPHVYLAIGESAVSFQTFERTLKTNPGLFSGKRVLAVQEMNADGTAARETSLAETITTSTIAVIERNSGARLKIAEVSQP